MIPLADWYAGGEWREALGQRMFLRQAGAGEALLLIHGFPTASWDWQALWPALVGSRRLIAPDLLGLGRSAKPHPHQYRVMEQADLLVALLSQLEVRRCHVLAHDYGDTVAQELLARQVDNTLPFALDSVVFLNGGLFPETHRARPIQQLLRSPLGPLLARLTGKRAFAASLRRVFGPESPPGEAEIEGFWQLLRHDQGRRCLPALLGYIDERRQQRARWVGALQRSPIPLGLINGLLDPVSGAHMVNRWRELVGKQHIVELPRIGHYPQAEAPQAVLDAYAELRRQFAEPH